MRLKNYFIKLDTGEISKKRTGGMKLSGAFETYGYRNAQLVARLIKKDNLEGALMAANNGIELWVIKSS